jgi:lipopolysaccharide export system permease protein
MLATSRIFERYFFWETFKPFILCVFIITFVLMLDRIVDLLTIIFEKDLDILTIINLFALSMPFIVALSVPMSVLTASIMSFARLSVDAELVAAKSTGINIYGTTKLLLVFFLLLAVGMGYFNDFIMPETNHVLKNLMIKVAYKKPITAIKPGTFTTMNSLTIYARDRDDEALHDLLIFNLENTRFPQTVQAKRGEMFLDTKTDQMKVDLYDGVLYERDSAHPERFNITTFEKYTFFRGDLGYGSDEEFRSDFRGNREQTSVQLLDRIRDNKESIERIRAEMLSLQEQEIIADPAEVDEMMRRLVIEENVHPDDPRIHELMQSTSRRNNVLIAMKQSQLNEIERQNRIFTVEIHKKYTLAISCFIFLLIGIPIGMMSKTSGIGPSFALSSVIFVFYNVMLVMGEEVGSRGIIHPALTMWIPAIVQVIAAAFLIYISLQEKTIDIRLVWNWIPGVWRKLRKRKNSDKVVS